MTTATRSSRVGLPPVLARGAAIRPGARQIAQLDLPVVRPPDGAPSP